MAEVDKNKTKAESVDLALVEAEIGGAVANSN